MALTDKELLRLKKACSKLEDGDHYRYKHYVENLLNTVLDFQMHVAVVEASIKYFFHNHNIKSHRKLKELVDSFPNTKSGNLNLANCLWNNNHWSRAKFLRKLMNYFDKIGIKGQKSLEKWVKTSDFEKDVYGMIKTKEHSMGYAIFKWLQLRCGVNTVKPDVHIINYVSRAVKRHVTPEEAVEGLKMVAKILKRKAYRIDSAIWNLERGLSPN
jgi:hypothetical protein